ncbi:MAG: hypothetical protein ACXABV_14400 [Candidatus Thorarchaeota archaeon]
MNEESSIEELRGEIDDLRREVNQQGTCLRFLWIVVVLLALLTVFQFDLALVFISVIIVIALGAYILEKRGL